MLKQDKNVTFSVGGKTEAITCDDIETLVANEISFHFTQKDSDTVLGSNFIYNCKLQRFSFPNWEDVPNIFMPGTKLIIDCKNAEVTLDSGDGQVNAQGIGKLGNDWETFLLTTGTNVITLDYSDWTTVPPTGELKYRKVYL